MRLRKPLSILLSLSMIAGMSAFASNAAVTSDESVSAGNYYNANYLESYAKPPQHGKPGHLMRHL